MAKDAVMKIEHRVSIVEDNMYDQLHDCHEPEALVQSLVRCHRDSENVSSKAKMAAEEQRYEVE